jgi:hypothetical protein
MPALISILVTQTTDGSSDRSTGGRRDKTNVSLLKEG